MIERKLIETGLLTVDLEGMAQMSQDDKVAFALARRNGFGASDSSIILGVNPYQDLKTLIETKRSTTVTDEELAIGDKVNVRKGSELEPLILCKFAKQFGVEVFKPQPMYRLEAYPWLTINFDGITVLDKDLVPVEAKFVSTYADKYWKKQLSIDNIGAGTPKLVGGKDVADHITQAADLYGIPPYYYTQVQHQMLGTGTDFAYLTALFDRDWNLYTYKIYKDRFVQDTLIDMSDEAWHKVKEDA